MNQNKRFMNMLDLWLLSLAVIITIGWIVKFPPGGWHTVHILTFCACLFIGLNLVKLRG